MHTSTDARPDMHVLAREIAAYLTGWTAKPHDGVWLAYLVHADGPKLALRHEKGRVKVLGTWPVGTNGAHFYPYNASADISCALGRGAQAIAKEIQRRLLPIYVPLWQEQDRKREASEQSDREAQALVRRLEDAFGLAHRNHEHRGRNDAMHVYFARATFTVYRYGSYEVELRTDEADAVLRIAELVKALKPEGDS